MQTNIKLPFLTLLLLISFASVNAVLFTPALPSIANFFAIGTDAAQYTITLYLIGYTLGQLLYGPLANRFGRKPALYAGITLQILSSFLCVFSGVVHEYSLLVFARFLLALGAGVGLKMTFTLVNECYEPQQASQKISYLILAFAITPGLSVTLGGYLTSHFGWTSCFYASAIYGLIMLFAVTRLPETKTILDYKALKVSHLIHDYAEQFKNSRLVLGGILIGIPTCFVYVFAALAPFIAIDIYGMNSAEYGLANLIPPIGLISGSLVGARLVTVYSLKTLLKIGMMITSLGVITMLIAMLNHLPIIISLFMPMALIYFGMCFIMSNGSTLAMGTVTDKAHGAAVMSFINMGVGTLAVLSLDFFHVHALLLPAFYIGICFLMIATYKLLFPNKTTSYI